MRNMSETSLSGRRKQAALNDDLILEAAREVFLADPTAPISAVAKRAGVGISALYRRFPSKEEMLRGLCADGQQVYLREVRRALEDDGDPWEVYAEFLHRIVAEDTHALGTRLAGLFTPSEAMFADAGEMQRLGERLFNRTKKAGALRPGLTFVDVAMLLEAVANVRLGDAVRSAEVRQRMVAVLVEGLRAGGPKLPGRAPTWEEQSARWHPDK
jgi:AcrR family transcriptional regulator